MTLYVNLLLGLPFIGALVSESMRRLSFLRDYAWTARAISAGLVLVAAWGLRPLDGAVSPFDWLGASPQTLPIVLSAYLPGAVLIIGWASIHFYHTFILREQKSTLEQSLFFAVIFVGMVLAAFASNSVTLLIGLTITDLAFTLNALLRGSNPRVVMIDFCFNSASVVILLLISAMRTASNADFYFPYTKLSPALTGLAMLAILLRTGMLPLRNLRDITINARRTAGRTATLILIGHLVNLGVPQIPVWMLTLLLASSAVLLGFGLFTRQRSSMRSSLQAGAFFMACATAATQQPTLAAMSGATWLLGIVLVNHPSMTHNLWAHRFTRMIRALGVLCLIGMPLTIGFPGTFGLLNTLAGPSLAPITRALLLAIWTMGQTLLIACALRVAANLSKPNPEQSYLQTWMLLPDFLAFSVVCVPVLAFGMAPWLLGQRNLPDMLLRTHNLSWLIWVLALITGIIVWRLERGWQQVLTDIIQFADTRIAALNGRLPWRHNWRLHTLLPFFWNRVALLWLGVVSILTWFVIRSAHAW